MIQKGVAGRWEYLRAGFVFGTKMKVNWRISKPAMQFLKRMQFSMRRSTRLRKQFHYLYRARYNIKPNHGSSEVGKAFASRCSSKREILVGDAITGHVTISGHNVLTHSSTNAAGQ